MRDERVMCCAIAVAFEAGLLGERDLFGVEVDERTACVRGSARIIDTISSSCARSVPDSVWTFMLASIGRCGGEPLFPY